MATTSGGAGRLRSQNLGDFLRIKEEEHHHILINRTSTNSGVDRNTISGLTLSALLSDKVRPPPEEPLPRVQSNRTLLDIIQDDQDPRGEDGGQSWRHLTERLRLSCRSSSGSGWTSTAPNVTVNNDGGNRMMPRRLFNFSSDSTERNISDVSRRSTERAIGRFEQTTSLLPMRRSQTPREADNINHNSNEGEGAAEVEQQLYSGRVSLMTLLAETDGSIYMLEEEEKGVVDLEEFTGGGGDSNCCVCMIRRKGAAFIPCGHTFCRMCSRQLLVERRNCPLCNAPIHEILDIF
ncbi:uncharacterized protein [Primulina huaijiensis]|uniref:uncharacterized protein n=1 Tax=Primulina huaijiensis TaxID=1492673 RepID=UPI003CC703E7